MRIGLQVAALCAVMVVAGGGTFFAYLLLKAQQKGFNSPDAGQNPTTGAGIDPGAHEGERHLLVVLDPRDLAVAAVLVGLLAILLAGLGGMLIARRAVRPLADAMSRQRTFVADASHELRTPLAVLHARVQQLRAQVPKDDPRREIVNQLREDTTILVGIVNDLLDSVAAEPDPHARAELTDALIGVDRDMRVLAQDRGVCLMVHPDGAPALAVAPAALRRCLVALTDNALSHTPTGGTVAVSWTLRGKHALIDVTDTGTGIAGIDPAHVFDRFAHGTPTAGTPTGALPVTAASGGETGETTMPDAGGRASAGARTAPGTSPTGTRSGYGIGLALVRELATRYGGSAQVVSTGSVGTTFRLTLPVARDSQNPGPRKDGNA